LTINQKVEVKNETLEAFKNWAHAVTAELQCLSLKRGGGIVTVDQLGEAMKILHDAIQNEEVSS